MYTDANLGRRFDLKRHWEVRREIRRFWDLFSKDGNMRVCKEEYVEAMVRMCKVLTPEFNEKEAREIVEVRARARVRASRSCAARR